MATQQYGYGPNVWAPAKGTGVQKFATLAQPGAVAPQFKAENKYKAFAAKAIGEMAYGAIQNQQAKKNEAIRMQKLDRDNNKQFEYERMNPKVDPEGVSPGTGDRGIGLDSSQFEKTIVPLIEKDDTAFDVNSAPGEPVQKIGKNGVMGTWSYVTERKPIGMKAPAWKNKLDGGYKPGGEWKWKANEYTGNTDDYKSGDRVQVRGMVYQITEGLNGMMTITPVY